MWLKADLADRPTPQTGAKSVEEEAAGAGRCSPCFAFIILRNHDKKRFFDAIFVGTCRPFLSVGKSVSSIGEDLCPSQFKNYQSRRKET